MNIQPLEIIWIILFVTLSQIIESVSLNLSYE